MQFIATESKVKVERKKLPTDKLLLSLYCDPPQQELTIDEFETISLARLQLLRSIETTKLKGGVEGDASFTNQVNEVKIDLFVCAFCYLVWRLLKNET
jgi:hypothetical protein